jgi:sulfur-oxidizing protein SoxZ
MSQTIKVRIRREGEHAEVRALLIHPMETGLRKDPLTGDTVPRHHITRIRFTHNGRVVLVAHCSTAVAKNPLLDFSFDRVRAGDRFGTEWVDTLGVTDSVETVVE